MYLSGVVILREKKKIRKRGEKKVIKKMGMPL